MNETWLQLLGRWHPVLVHAPLGALFALVAVELAALFGEGKDESRARTPRRLLCTLTALSAVAAATSGWFLAEEGEYGGAGLDWHRRLGIALAVVLAVACLAALLRRGRVYGAALTGSLVLAAAAGHFGGELTHGPGFLFEPLRRADTAEDVAMEADEPTWYEAIVAPVFAARCARCHGEAKHKGGLSLHDPEALLAGGDAGPAIVPGDATASELVRRLRLDLEHDDHMPPDTKPQPTAAEIDAIATWIEAGASFDAPPPAGVMPVLVAESSVPEEPEEALASAPELTTEQLAALQTERIHAEIIDPASQGLWLHFAARSDADDALVEEQLRSVLPFIVDLSLAGTQISDDALRLTSRMPRLERLDLSRTACTALGLEALAAHPTLRTLVLTDTAVDDGAVETLASLPALETLFAWRTAVSPAALAELGQRRDALRIVADSSPDAEPLETEAPWSPGGDDRLEPSNTTCPISGKPVDPRYRIVHEGQVIAFCCAACPATFWASLEATGVGD